MPTTPYTSITAAILAGGQGRRMGGQDKGLIDFQGRPLVKHLITALQPQCATLLINANRNQDRYQQYGYPVISDELTDFQGPLAGFASAMHATRTLYLMTVPCDGPQIAPDMADRLFQALQREQAELAVAHDGERLQPVHALLPIRLLGSLQRFLTQGGRKIDQWYAEHHMAQADFADIAPLFRNINTPEQKQQLEQEQAPLS